MKTIFSLPDGPTLGGVTTWTAEMCRRLSSAGRPVALVEHVTFNPKLPLDLFKKIERIDCTAGQHADSLFLKEKDATFFAQQYQQGIPATIIPNWSVGTYAACAQIAAEQPESLRVIGYAHTDEDLYYDWLTYYEPIIHHFVCVSVETGGKLMGKIPHRIGDISIQPYAVHAPKILNRSYSTQLEPLKLIYAGRIAQRQKRVFDLILLIEQLVSKQVNFNLRIIGNGDEYQSLSQKLEDLGSEGKKRVTLEPGLLPDQMAETWRSADVFLSVSEYEGTSIAMLEAMGQGCVPVVTQVSGTQSVIVEGENGFSVEIGDAETMATSIARLDDQRNEITKLGCSAHQTILNRYAYDEYINWFEQLIDNVWQLPNRPWPSNRPIIPPRLSGIKRADLNGALKGDPAARRILQHKLLHATRLATPYYFMRGIAQRILDPSQNN